MRINIRRGMTSGLLTFLSIGMLGLSGQWTLIQAQEPLSKYAFTQRHMGVDVKLTLYAPDEATAIHAAEAAYKRIAELNAIFSDYDPDSEVMRLCKASGPGKPIEVSRELMTVLVESLKLSRQTDGAFDVTVGPLVKVWRRARRRNELPSPELLEKAASLTGWQLVKLDEKARTVELLKEGMLLDFGGIAKGYIADEALKVLKVQGVSRASIDAGGDLVVGDPPPNEPGWRVGIASLKDPQNKPGRFLYLKNQGVATSGDTYQFIEIDGVRYSHILDPKTGLGLTLRSSVTVVAPTGMLADALASTVSVLGPVKGMEFIEKCQETAALVLYTEGDQVFQKESKGLKDWEKCLSQCGVRNQFPDSSLSVRAGVLFLQRDCLECAKFTPLRSPQLL